MKVRVLFGWMVVFITVLLVGAGCSQNSDQSQALKDQQQKNEELQKKLDAQSKKQEAAKKQEETKKQEDLQQRISNLEKTVKENKSNPPKTSKSSQKSQPEQKSNPPTVVIQSNPNWTAPPSQAPQGVVVVSPNFEVQDVNAEEAQALNGAIAYYQDVELGDYRTTHSLLSVSDQNRYPVDTWVRINTALDSAAGAFVVTDAYPEDIGNGYPTYAVTVEVYLNDGTSSSRKTYFVNEGNGYWAHWLTQEEMNLFDNAL